jgi:hypothetical protein
VTLSELAAAMFRFSRMSDAWKDFAIDCRERLNVASLTAVAGVETPADFSEYWLSIAWKESEDYESMVRRQSSSVNFTAWLKPLRVSATNASASARVAKKRS